MIFIDDHPCFWCYKVVPKKECTRDHFLSKPLWRIIGVHQLPDRSPKCVSCAQCNSQRGAISGLYLELERLKRKFNNKKFLGWLKGKKRLMPDMQLFRTKITTSVKDEVVKTLCLQEIDDILAFHGPRNTVHESIQLNAYHLWIRAGRPYGQDETFWLKAEQQMGI